MPIWEKKKKKQKTNIWYRSEPLQSLPKKDYFTYIHELPHWTRHIPFYSCICIKSVRNHYMKLKSKHAKSNVKIY